MHAGECCGTADGSVPDEHLVSDMGPSSDIEQGGEASLPAPARGESEAVREEAAPSPSEEEQMEKFEEALKEADWGHQPC